jgi:hypothetical protein
MRIKRIRVTYVVSLLAIIGISLLCAHRYSQGAAAKKDLNPADVKIINNSPGFEVVGIEKTSPTLWQVKFKNSYDKTITAFQASSGDNNTFYEEMIVESDRCISCILPGATYIRLFPPIKTLTIFAVIFENGSGDGDSAKVKEVIDIREGKAKAMRDFISRVQRVTISSVPSPEALRDFKREFLTSAAIDDTTSADERYGFESGRTELLAEIQRIQKEGLGDIKTKLRKYAEDLHQFSQRLSKPSKQ